MKWLFRWIFRKELDKLAYIPEQIKTINEMIEILNKKLDAIHESMQGEVARMDNDIQDIADLETENQEKIKKLEDVNYENAKKFALNLEKIIENTFPILCWDCMKKDVYKCSYTGNECKDYEKTKVQ